MIAPEISRGSFSGHETFPFRYAWLPKAARRVAEDPRFFGREDAMALLGVGKNMVQSMRHWGMVTGIIAEVPGTRGRELVVTDLGKHLFLEDAWDPFLEDPATLWLLHWQIASTHERATTWYWAFNHLAQPEFSRADLLRWLSNLARERGWSRVPESSLRRDVDCFVRTYVPSRPTRLLPLEDTLDCPLTELGLIREFGQRGNYLLERANWPTLPDELFAHTLVAFLKGAGTTAKTLPMDAMAFSPGSPGRVFALTEEAILLRLDRLTKVSAGALVFDETAGLRQLLIRELPDDLDFLAAYYKHPRRVPEKVAS